MTSFNFSGVAGEAAGRHAPDGNLKMEWDIFSK